MIDPYTKLVLSVIAISLAAIALQMASPNASAQLGGGCGSSLIPCYVASFKPLEVRIKD
jgi:hypothetical protein